MAIKEITSPERAEVQLQWNAVLERDLLWDGVFFFGVRSTGIYCRPSCPSRRPRRNQVRFFSVTNAAEDAGFRACLRCKPNDVAPPGPVRMVQLVCTLLEQDLEGAHTLTAICQRIGVGPRTVQRAFKRTLDVTFQEYAGALRLQRFKSLLQSGNIVTDALYQAGYGSSSQLYSDTHSLLGMTPGEYHRGGEGTAINYACAPYNEGWVAAATSTHGLCALLFGHSADELASTLRQEFPNAQIEASALPFQEQLQTSATELVEVTPVPGLPEDVQQVALRHRFMKALQPSNKRTPI